MFPTFSCFLYLPYLFLTKDDGLEVPKKEDLENLLDIESKPFQTATEAIEEEEEERIKDAQVEFKPGIVVPCAEMLISPPVHGNVCACLLCLYA